MGNKDRYWALRSNGRCVACGKPAGGKSRCPKCMKDQIAASIKSQKLRLQRMKDRIRELEAEVGR